MRISFNEIKHRESKKAIYRAIAKFLEALADNDVGINGLVVDFEA
jgi:hypothetical protein